MNLKYLTFLIPFTLISNTYASDAPVEGDINKINCPPLEHVRAVIIQNKKVLLQNKTFSEQLNGRTYVYKLTHLAPYFEDGFAIDYNLLFDNMVKTRAKYNEAWNQKNSCEVLFGSPQNSSILSIQININPGKLKD